MKRRISIVAGLLLSIGMMAETYTIVFNSSDADATNTPADLANYIFTATNNCVFELLQSEKINRAKEGFGIKGGTSGEKGVLTLGLDATYSITTLTVYAAPFVTKSGTPDNKKILVCGKELIWDSNYYTEIHPYSFTLNQGLDNLSITSSVKSSNRWYIQKIVFEAENPHPDQPVIEMQYAALSFEAASWISDDEPMEDVIGFEIVGKNLREEMALSMKTAKSKFTVMPNILPKEGGEGSVSYSISMSSPPSIQATYRDTVVVTATGKDNTTISRKLPVDVTVKPKSSSDGTFALDTTCMVVGPMPGDYYQYAQGTTDSVLKNHLGAIICCGKRYKYGSGTNKTWDAFYYTDRDPNTNEVLDMYSLNHRYFNPDKPTASVADFDIEHMLPKSWWGGDVNPAYCDLYHLVPGDYSANRSKSNHAPGIPADSTFNNGSFVTGSGAAYGLTRVFCPADQYKGDFARAYFYIATCYGDLLKWLTTGEPGVAMTNEGWQEFQPWLRDLLVSWHRLDPVSKKELDRAIEVNKIQGNRNPFIDYPELVEYIWGNKQGEAVDFRTLVQSYGDAYDDTPTGVCNTSASTSGAYKEIRDGAVVIVRGMSIYTPLGQQIR